MSQLRTDIIIGMKADTAGIDEARRALFSLRDVTQGAGIASGALGLNFGLSSLTAFVRRGVEFNSTIETAQVGVAALFRQFRPVEFKTFEAALVASTHAVALLRQEAANSPATFKELLTSYQATAGAMLAAGIPIEAQVKLINRLAQAAKGFGLGGSQIVQESRALLTGNIGPDAQLAVSLGIKKADIDAAKQAGTLLGFLNDKLAAFGEAAKATDGTLAKMGSDLEDSLDNLAGRLAKPLFDELKKGAADFKAALDGLSDSDLRDIASGMADAARAAGLLARGLIEASKSAKDIALAVAAIAAAQKAFDLSRAASAFAASAASGATAPTAAGAGAAGIAAVSYAAASFTVAVASFEIGKLIADRSGLTDVIGKSLAETFGPEDTGSTFEQRANADLRSATIQGDAVKFTAVQARISTEAEKRSKARQSIFKDVTGLNGPFDKPFSHTPEMAALISSLPPLREQLSKNARRIAYTDQIEASTKARAEKESARAARLTPSEDQSKELAKLTEARDKLLFKASTPAEQQALLEKAFIAALLKTEAARRTVAKEATPAAKAALLSAESQQLELAIARRDLAVAAEDANSKQPLAPFSPAIFADSLTKVGGSLSGKLDIRGAGGAGAPVNDYAKTTAAQSEEQTKLLRELVTYQRDQNTRNTWTR